MGTPKDSSKLSQQVFWNKKIQGDARSQSRRWSIQGGWLPAPRDRRSGDTIQFIKLHRDKYPNAVECIEKNWTELTIYFKYPAAHWKHLRTTNPIESSFATVKLRTKVTKGAGSVKTATVMAFKLLSECQNRWRKISAREEIKNVLAGLEYKDGIVVATPSTHQETAVS